MKPGGKILLVVIAVTLVVVGFWYNDIVALLGGGENNEGDTNNPGSQHETTPGSDDEGNNSVDPSLYFSRNRLDRNASRSRLRATLEDIIQDENAPEEVISEAYEKIILLARQANTETELEGLIRQRGFSDVFVSFSETGELEVIVNAESLNEEQVTQITEIIRRNTNIPLREMSIRNVA